MANNVEHQERFEFVCESCGGAGDSETGIYWTEAGIGNCESCQERTEAEAYREYGSSAQPLATAPEDFDESWKAPNYRERMFELADNL